MSGAVHFATAPACPEWLARGGQPCALPTTCHPPLAWGDKEPWPATIRDLSLEGLSLGLERRFERGTGLAIELPAVDGPSTVLARVVQIKPQTGGGWVLHCSFISPLSDEELDYLLALDRARRAPRAPAPLVSWHDLSRADEGTPSVEHVLFQVALRPGAIVRWCVNRLAPFKTWPLQRGQEIALQFQDTPAGTFPLELRVYHCRPRDGGWVINGHFVCVPAPAVLRVLGHLGA